MQQINSLKQRVMNRKSKAIKKVQRHESPKVENRGKPPLLKTTELQVPNIWTNQQQCVQFVRYLTDEGRHFSLHQAGKHSTKVENTKKDEKIKDTKIYYEYAQGIVEELFKINCASKRCIVYFFRGACENKLDEDCSVQLFNNNYQIVFGSVQKLLSQTFLQDLICILNNDTNIDLVIEQLFQPKQYPFEYSQIIQNLFIKQKIKKMMGEKKQKPKIESVEKEFQAFLNDVYSKQMVSEFIQDIISIFQNQSIQIYQLEQAQYYDVDKQNILD